MKETLYNKMFKMLASLILLTTLVLLLVVWNSTSNSTRDGLNKRLKLAQSVVLREVNNRKQTIIQNSHLLMNESSFKRVINTNNLTAMKQGIESYKNILDAAFITIRYEDGSELASTEQFENILAKSDIDKGILRATKRGDTSNLLKIDRGLVWVFWLPLKGEPSKPQLYSGLGFIIGQSYLDSLKDLIAFDISLLTNAKQTFMVSTLPKSKQNISYIENSILDNSKSALWFLNLLTNPNTLFSHQFTIQNTNEIVSEVFISSDARELKSEFLHLQLTISVIAFIALLIAIIAGRIIAKQITRPLDYMVNYAKNISQGNYSSKLELDTCSLEIEHLIDAFKSMTSGVKRRESEIVFQAQHDMLTSLYNRNYFTEYLNKLLSNKTTFQAVGINIKGFRSINDVFGYQYGDLVLQELAARVHQLGGVSARLTGGEILWIPDEPLRIPEIEKLKVKLENNIQSGNLCIPLKTSIGILNCPSDTKSTEDLYRRMNIVIDEAQLTPSLLIEYNKSFESKYLRRLSIVNQLRSALSSDSEELSLCYQPKVNIATKEVKHVEALIRWNNAELGAVAPDEFITIAEHAGLINDVTKWVLRHVVIDLLNFRKNNMEVCVAINISAQDLLDDEFVNFSQNLLSNNKLKSKNISFELTECVIVKEPEKSIRQMQALRDAGFSLAIDDFGTGYSSLSYLTQLPIDVIKIDKCFVIPLAYQLGQQSICKSVINLASDFSMEVVAEGVEDLASLKLLNEWGCNYAQGYYISRPISALDLINWMESTKIPALIN